MLNKSTIHTRKKKVEECQLKLLLKTEIQVELN